MKKKLTLLLLLLLLLLLFMTLAAIEIVLIRKFMKVKADIPPVDGHAASDFFSGSFLSYTLYRRFVRLRNSSSVSMMSVIVSCTW